jgi:hypothetical protein
MSNFNVNIGSDGVAVLSFESERADECIKYAISNDIKRISLLDRYHAKDMASFLPFSEFLEGLILNDKVDFSAIHCFKNLNYLGAPDNKRNTLDLVNFPKLETLACSITARLKGLEFCKKLKSLTISRYNKTANLATLPFLPSLEHLNIIMTDINNLGGVEKFTSMKHIEIFRAPSLHTIGALGLVPNLTEIALDTCKKIQDYDSLKKVRSLQKIILLNCGQIPSLAFVDDLHQLKFISFVETDVLDGDISHCEGLEYVGFDDKRHYNRKMRDFPTK